jgi:hypothetical protein
MKYVLSLRLKASARSGVEYGNPPMFYEVDGLPTVRRFLIEMCDRICKTLRGKSAVI